ncbi:MBL fold metallo-hydrolase [Paenibacillus gorillae]|uniref:MBL fold metallo-hydrolase n=1 Tax=Paenibacillus gorillae TaxID=1243662 RepID=UPI0004BBC836|nr:MBL fold metallo-hydrolase [Paenibacillus gorillae]
MKIANGVEMLEIHVMSPRGPMVLNPTLIYDGNSAILVDAGMPGQSQLIVEAMSKAGVAPSQLQAIILTHQDLDHIGGAPEIIQAAGKSLPIYAHKLDQPYMEGKLPLVKANPERMAKLLSHLPEEELRQALEVFQNPPKVPVDQLLEDGQVLPVFGGIQVIFTPGHTPGHISLYLQESKTLIAADAMVSSAGKLHGPVEQNTPDMETAVRSLSKFLELDIENVICYHGGLSQSNIREQLLILTQGSN